MSVSGGAGAVENVNPPVDNWAFKMNTSKPGEPLQNPGLLKTGVGQVQYAPLSVQFATLTVVAPGSPRVSVTGVAVADGIPLPTG
jgi:hypothetical protein